jgi:phosphoenolpyruvate synthase/pyruvate phosphate dikinase
MDLILDFRKLNKSSLPLVGGKNASLGEMINADIRVPPGFAVTTDSYAVFMEKAGINHRQLCGIYGESRDKRYNFQPFGGSGSR